MKRLWHVIASGMAMKYIWERKNWFDFTYDEAALLRPLSELHKAQGMLLGKVTSLDLSLKTEAQAVVLVEEAVRTAESRGRRLIGMRCDLPWRRVSVCPRE
jgi:hypothetical protein